MNIGNHPRNRYIYATRRRSLGERAAGALLALAWGTAIVAYAAGCVIMWPLWLVWRALRGAGLAVGWLLCLPRRFW